MENNLTLKTILKGLVEVENLGCQNQLSCTNIPNRDEFLH